MSHYKPYPAYKDSGVEWIGEVPDEWEAKPLKRLSSCNDDVLPESTDPETEIEYIDISSVSSEKGVETTESMHFGSAPSRARRKARAGDLVISTVRTYLKAIASVTEKTERAVFSTGFAVIRPMISFAPGFARYALHANYFMDQVIAESVGISYPAINSSDLTSIKITVPSYLEQSSIASFLDRETAKIDTLISKQEKFIELLKEKRQAVISHAVTKGLNPKAKMKDSGVEWLGEVPEHWGVKSIKWLSSVQRGASPRPIDDQKYFDDDGEYAWVRITDVSASDGNLQETTQHLSELGSSLSVKIQPNELFVSIAGTVGKPCISGIKACIHDGFVYFPELKISPMYLYRIFEAGICFGGLGKLGTQLNLNTDTIGSIRIALPPLSEIEDVLSFLDRETARIDSLILKSEKAIDLQKEHRAALISAAVTGKIDVRGAV